MKRHLFIALVHEMKAVRKSQQHMIVIVFVYMIEAAISLQLNLVKDLKHLLSVAMVISSDAM